MAAKKTTKEPGASDVDPRFVPVVDTFADHRDVTGGKMMSSYGLKVNGKIFTMFGRGKFTVKLAKDRVDELVARGEGERFNPGHGRLMKEWVTVEFGKESWVELAKQAYEFVKLGTAKVR